MLNSNNENTFLSLLSFQMQYLSWPDHGTPSDSVEFVEFVESVRDFREKSATVAPTIVHCR